MALISIYWSSTKELSGGIEAIVFILLGNKSLGNIPYPTTQLPCVLGWMTLRLAFCTFPQNFLAWCHFFSCVTSLLPVSLLPFSTSVSRTFQIHSLHSNPCLICTGRGRGTQTNLQTLCHLAISLSFRGWQNNIISLLKRKQRLCTFQSHPSSKILS